MRDVTVGTAPINWNNEDVPDYRPRTPYDLLLDEMARAGYEGTEIGSEFPREPEQILRDLGARGLRPASRFCAVNLRVPAEREAEIERAERVARFLASLGEDIIIIADSGDEHRRSIAGRVSRQDMLDDAGWRSMAEGLHALAKRCGSAGVRLAFHNHVGTYVETEEELRRLLDMTEPDLVGLCFDVGHMQYAAGNVMQIAERYGGRIRYLHLKDVDPEILERCRRERLGFHDALRLGIFTEFGNGMLDFKRLFEALDAHRYAGWVIVEQDTTMKTPFESAKINRDYLRTTVGL